MTDVDPDSRELFNVGHTENDIDFGDLARSLQIGIVVAEPETWIILFENAKFFQWFSPSVSDGQDTLVERIEGFPEERATKRLEAGRGLSFETEVKAGARTTKLRIDVSMTGSEENPMVLVECADISKEMEAQYLLESYSKLAEKNARELEKEKERGERLLLNIMPRAVLDELKDLGTTTPKRYDDVTILLLDFVGFTEMTIADDPATLLAELNDIFSAFDRITEAFGCERIKTIGDAYMAVSGLPEADADHAHNIARVALRMRRYLERRNDAHPQQWLARIGFSSGAVIGSLVGVTKYVYDLFGPGVNLAARMEAISESMRITLPEDTYQLIKDDFDFNERGEVEIKGFGIQKVYFLENELARPF